MRISGVKVGKVRKVEPNEETGLTDAVLEIDARYAPIAKDTRAILRQKTLLGRDLRGARARDAAAGDGARRRRRAAARARSPRPCELDEILRTFDPETRRAVLDLARPAGPGGARQRRGDQRRARQPHAVRREHRRRARGAAMQSGATRRADPQHRRGVRRAVRAPGPAARADRELEPGLGGHRPARRRARRHLPGAADLPARGPHHHRAA